jgi:hypothetical protein
MCQGINTRTSAQYRKLGFDLTIIDEDSISALPTINPQLLALKAEQQKVANYQGFFELNQFIVIPVGITTRGTCGPGAKETIDLLIEFSKRKRKKTNVAQLKKEIMCAMKKSDSQMREAFARKIYQQVRIDYKKKKRELMLESINDDEQELQHLTHQY